MSISTPPAGTQKGRHVFSTRIRLAPLILLLLFLALFLAGIATDEPARVLEQARSVCLPCIGIG